jgi:hypothetical protein
VTLLVFNTFFGWLMTTLFAAGVSGLLQTGKDESYGKRWLFEPAKFLRPPKCLVVPAGSIT